LDSVYFTFLAKFSYFGLFAILIAAGLGVPLPEDIPLLAAGWLVHKGSANLELMIATGLLGVLVGDSLLFSMGRRYGDHIVDHKWLRWIAKPWLVEKARQKYANHGAKILFAARFMPGLRAVLFLTAGVFKVPYWKFLAIDGFAALISVPVWVWLGKEFSGHIEQILGGARIASYVVGGVLVVGLIIWGIYEYRHNLRRRNREATYAGAGRGEARIAPLVGAAHAGVRTAHATEDRPIAAPPPSTVRVP